MSDFHKLDAIAVADGRIWSADLNANFIEARRNRQGWNITLGVSHEAGDLFEKGQIVGALYMAHVDDWKNASPWQPIETAPTDMTRVLFYTPADEETGYLAFMCVSYIDSGGLHTYQIDQWEDGLRPTHWMPLPAPPVVKP